MAAGLTSIALAVTGVPGFFAAAHADPSADNLVVNEVYGGGGNSGAPWTNDFIELYNPTSAAISVDGWSVQGRSAASTQVAGNSGSNLNVTSLTGSVPSHGYYLVQEAAGATVTDKPLPTPDATGKMAIGASGWQIWLADTTTPLNPPAGNVPAGTADIVDFVGGATNAASFETAPVGTAPANATSVYRTTAGVDTDNNKNDFSTGTPTPENSHGDTTAPAPTGVTVASPGNKTFTQGTQITPVTLTAAGGTAPYTWAVTSGTLPAGLSLSSDGTLSGTPSAAGSATITVTATDSTGATGTASFTITVQAPPQQVAIADIQTTDPTTSPMVGQTVTTTGVVTADYATGGFAGFYLQTGGTGGATDATPGESDAIFVYGSTSAAQVSVGESVSVTGKVSLYQGALEIGSPTVTQLATALAPVTPAQIPWSDLATDAQKYAHEGELIAPQGDFTVTDNYNANFYGEIELASGDAMLKQPTDVGTPGSDAAKAAAAYNVAHEVTLDDGSSTTFSPTGSAKTQPLPWLTSTTPVSDGAKVTFHQPVVLDFRNDLWKFQPQQPVVGDGSAVATFSDMRTQNATPGNVGSDVRLATFNMENFFPTTGEDYVASGEGTCTWYDDNAGEHIAVNDCEGTDGSAGPRGAATDDSFQRQLAKEITSINGLGASVISLEEVENGAQFVSAIPTAGLPASYDGDPRDYAVSVIVDALNAKDGAGTWAYVPSPAAAHLPPLAEQDVIRTAFIYQPSAITPVGVSHVLTGDSDAGQPFSIAREPMAQGFKAAGTPDSDAFLVVANHLKSKGADSTALFNDCGTGHNDTDDLVAGDPGYDPSMDQGGFNCTRVHQVRDMWTWAQSQAQALDTSKIFLVGDFNAYDHEDPIQYLLDQGLTDVGAAKDAGHSSYSYGGLEGSLDHVLATSSAYSMVTGASIWQINAQESVAYAYSRYHYSGTTPDLFDGATPWATSDHDPEVVGLELPAAPAPSLTAGDQALTYGTAGSISATVTDPTSGEVTFSEGTTTLGTATPDPSGVATLALGATALRPGTHTVTASYPGAGDVTFTVTVAKATPSVTGTATSVVYGHSGSLKVKVTGTAGTPTGTVTVTSGSTVLGSHTLSGGVATVTLAAGKLAVGRHTVTISYGGDSAYGAKSGSATVTVTKATATVTGSVSGTVHLRRTAAPLHVTIKVSGVTATGLVKVTANGHTITARVSGGKATIKLPKFTSTGTKSVKVAYLGDSHVNPKTITVHVHVVR